MKLNSWIEFARVLATVAVLATGYSLPAMAKNLHRMDPPANATAEQLEALASADRDANFAIYRTGRLMSFEEYEKLVCDLGVTEIFVLSNNGNEEAAYNEREAREGRCPTKKLIVHNFDQNVRNSVLTKGFLDEFDSWVQDAQAKGKKIAFRCNCGCHRTGRLAAYYEMKYMGRSLKAAQKTMKKLAHPGGIGPALYWWIIGGKLNGQTKALQDYIRGEACSTKKKHCWSESTERDPSSGPEEGDTELG